MNKELKGIFAVWKPKGPSSYDVIREIKKRITESKIGHAGTLDPKASGILVIAVGREATKKLSEEVAKEKEYRASIRLGVTSSTDDAEGIKSTTHPVIHAKKKDIEALLRGMVGTVMQTPPAYSAIKLQGQEAYKRVRAGEQVEMKPREVLIKSISIVSYRWPYLIIDVVTGPGVYIRSIARDVGRGLRVGGYLSSLVRTRVGEFTEKQAMHIKVRFNTPRKRS
jgi:tRNA pseudouridine55 synthase